MREEDVLCDDRGATMLLVLPQLSADCDIINELLTGIDGTLTDVGPPCL